MKVNITFEKWIEYSSEFSVIKGDSILKLLERDTVSSLYTEDITTESGNVQGNYYNYEELKIINKMSRTMDRKTFQVYKTYRLEYGPYDFNQDALDDFYKDFLGFFNTVREFWAKRHGLPENFIDDTTLSECFEKEYIMIPVSEEISESEAKNYPLSFTGFNYKNEFVYTVPLLAIFKRPNG